MNFAALGKNKSGNIKTQTKTQTHDQTHQKTNKGYAKLSAVAGLMALIFCWTPVAGKPALAVAANFNLQLVAARDQIQGSFTTSQSVYADSDSIYLASQQGQLFVLDRNRQANFPLRESLNLGAPVIAVRGDQAQLYLTSADGTLRVFKKGARLELVKQQTLSDFGLNSLAVIGNKLYVAKGQAALAVNNDYVFLSQLNQGETVLELDKTSLQITRIYGASFEANQTVVYNRATGAKAAVIENPTDVFGRSSQAALYANSTTLLQSIMGCCGPGLVQTKAGNLASQSQIPRPYTNTAIIQNNWLVAGSEAGKVDLFDGKRNLTASLDLRALTGHTGSEDIEIRALWSDSTDNLVFAASSWGNDQSRSAALPSLFVLELP